MKTPCVECSPIRACMYICIFEESPRKGRPGLTVTKLGLDGRKHKQLGRVFCIKYICGAKQKAQKQLFLRSVSELEWKGGAGRSRGCNFQQAVTCNSVCLCVSCPQYVMLNESQFFKCHRGQRFKKSLFKMYSQGELYLQYTHVVCLNREKRLIPFYLTGFLKPCFFICKIYVSPFHLAQGGLLIKNNT